MYIISTAVKIADQTGVERINVIFNRKDHKSENQSMRSIRCMLKVVK